MGLLPPAQLLLEMPLPQLLLPLLVKIRKLVPLPLPLDALLLPQRISISILLLPANGFNLKDGPAAAAAAAGGGSTFAAAAAAAAAASAASRFSTYPLYFATFPYFYLGGGSAVSAAAASAIGGSAVSGAAAATHQFGPFL